MSVRYVSFPLVGQPAAGAYRINEEHPLADALVDVWIGSDPLQSRGGRVVPSGVGVAVGAVGVAATFGTYASTSILSLSNTNRSRLVGVDGSVVAGIRFGTVTSGTYPNIWTVRDGATQAASFAAGLDTGSFTGGRISTGINGVDHIGSSGSLLQNAFAVYGAEWGANGRKLFTNGVSVGTSANTNVVPASSIQPALGNRQSGGRSLGPGSELYFAFTFSRNIGDYWHAELARDPWQLLRRGVAVPAAAAGGGTTITCSVGAADAPGVMSLVSVTVQAPPGAATAIGVTASVTTSTVIAAIPGETSATGVTARLNSTLNAGPGDATATGVTARANITVQSGPGAATATGVTALVNTSISAGVGAAAAAGVTALLGTSVNATPAEATAVGVTASIVTAGNAVISAAPGEASAAGVQARTNATLQAGPGEATATGVTASLSLSQGIASTPGEAGADGLAAQLQRIFGTTAAEAIAAGVTATIGTVTPTVGRPASDTSNSGWAASTGSDLFAMLDEVTPDAADYIVAATVGAVCELALNTTSYPGTASQVLKFRASSSTGNSLIVRLRNTGGATVRTTTQALTATDTEYSITLTAGEIAAITSGALSVQLESA